MAWHFGILPEHVHSWMMYAQVIFPVLYLINFVFWETHMRWRMHFIPYFHEKQWFLQHYEFRSCRAPSSTRSWPCRRTRPEGGASARLWRSGQGARERRVRFS